MISNRLSAIMGEKRLKISDVCKATRISRTALTAMYYGRSNGIEYSTLNKLCNYFRCQPNDLVMYVKDERLAEGRGGNADEYINPLASNELPPPRELADDKEHIRLLQEDIKRFACKDGQLRAQIAVLKKEIKRLRGLLGKKLKDADKPTVRELRGLKRWSCPELARQAGLTYDCVYKRERKVYPWREDQKKAVAKALGVDVEAVDWDD